MPVNPKIVQLRELLASRGLATATGAEERWRTDWPALDVATGGGLPKGDIAELYGASGGGALAVAQLLSLAAARREFTVLIDGADAFDLASVEPATLARLLWVRCRTASEAVKAADLILRDGNLPLVLLNIRSCSDAARVPSQAWYRLQRIVEQSGVNLIVLTSRPLIPSARARVTLHWRPTLDDLARDCRELAPSVIFEATRLQGARGTTVEEPQLAEVG